MREKRWSFVFVAILVIGLLAACSGEKNTPSTTTTTEEPASPNEEATVTENENATVIVGIKGSLLTLDPANHRDRVTESVLRNLFDGLVTRDEKGEVQGLIAESWENPTPTEWIFHLQEGVKFHDGSDLTADDVVFTFDRIIQEGAMGGETSPRKGLLEPVTEIQKLDDYSVKFILSEPWPILLKMLPHQQIIPKAYYEKVGIDEFRANPIGAGPYKFVEAKMDERIVLERFDDYYRGAPSIKNLVFDVIPETSTRVAAIQAGEVQRIHAISPTLVPSLENDPNLEVKMVDGTRVYMIEMNMNIAPFDKVKVRQAMNHAVNMDLILDKILGGYATRLAGPALQESFGINTNLKAYEYNPDKAKQLLEEAGYGNGFSVTIDTDANNKEVAEAVAAQLREIGVDANTRVWDMGVLKPMLLNGERQMAMTDYGNSTQDPYDFLNPKFLAAGLGNYSQFRNDHVEELLSSGAIELDNEKRKAIYEEVQQIIYDEAPWIFGYSMKEIEVGVKGLEGWEPSSDGMLYMPYVTLVK